MPSQAREGKTNRKGLPKPLRLAVIAKAHFDPVRLAFLPVAVQRAGLALGALLGKLLGYPEAVTTHNVPPGSRVPTRGRSAPTSAVAPKDRSTAALERRRR
jgi:hypothetical protein